MAKKKRVEEELAEIEAELEGKGSKSKGKDEDPDDEILSLDNAEEGMKVTVKKKKKEYEGEVTKVSKKGVTLEFEDNDDLDDTYDEDGLEELEARIIPKKKKDKKKDEDDDPPSKKGKDKKKKKPFSGEMTKEIKTLLRNLESEEDATEKKKIRASLRSKGYYVSANK